jgi:hypothetical protein
MEVSGKVKAVFPTKDVSASFRKRELVVTTEEQYPQHIIIEFTQDRCDLLNGVQAGEDVVVSINLRGREWVSPQGETKYFNTIQGWRIERKQAAAPSGAPMGAGAPATAGMPPMPPMPDNLPDEKDDDDLPF